MSTASTTDAAWVANPFTYRNNRGAVMVNGRQLRYGIPTPQPHRQADGKFREDDDAMKGGDLIGFRDVIITADMVGKSLAVFTSIEVKGPGDRLAIGQIRWHNWVLEHGGISEIWKEKQDGSLEVIADRIEGVNDERD